MPELLTPAFIAWLRRGLPKVLSYRADHAIVALAHRWPTGHLTKGPISHISGKSALLFKRLV